MKGIHRGLKASYGLVDLRHSGVLLIVMLLHYILLVWDQKSKIVLDR